MPPVTSEPDVTLTERQFQILALLAQGMSNRQIAERLVISSETVRTHRRHTLRRLGAVNVANAVWLLAQGRCVIGDRRACGQQRPALRYTGPPPQPTDRLPTPVTDPKSKLYLRALQRWIDSGFRDQRARDLMAAIHGHSIDPHGGDQQIRTLLEQAADDTLAPTP